MTPTGTEELKSTTSLLLDLFLSNYDISEELNILLEARALSFIKYKETTKQIIWFKDKENWDQQCSVGSPAQLYSQEDQPAQTEGQGGHISLHQIGHDPRVTSSKKVASCM